VDYTTITMSDINYDMTLKELSVVASGIGLTKEYKSKKKCFVDIVSVLENRDIMNQVEESLSSK
jgi:hypothetical protein